MNLDSYGSLQVRTYTASGALPIVGAIVRIKGAEEANSYIQYSVLTNNDGLTPLISLPTPSKEFSLSPTPGEAPYSVYDVEISAEGYYTKQIRNVPVFSGIKAILPIEMIPLTYGEDGSINPQNNLNSTIYENDKL